MLHLRIVTPRALSPLIQELLAEDPAVSALAVIEGAALRPRGDVVLADVSREAANDVIEGLRQLGVHEQGTVAIEPVQAWVSQPAFDADELAPGSSTDAVVWADVVHRAYDDSELNWTFLSFLTLATLIAAIAIVLDSQVLVIGAMVLGPEFGPIAALGLALVRKRYGLLRLAAGTLAFGFVAAIAVTTAVALAWRALGWVTHEDVAGERPDTAFIFTPDKWSFLVAVIAAAAGVLSLTSAKIGGLSGVFISITTVPAAGNLALGLAFGVTHEVRGSVLQLLINISGMAVAGWATLKFQDLVWARVSLRRTRLRRRRHDY